jgi:hypothetical protein
LIRVNYESEGDTEELAEGDTDELAEGDTDELLDCSAILAPVYTAQNTREYQYVPSEIIFTPSPFLESRRTKLI